jgi:hypothetical protein
MAGKALIPLETTPLVMWFQVCLPVLTVSQVASIHDQLRTPSGIRPFFLVRHIGGKVEVGSVEEYEAFFDGVPANNVRSPGLQAHMVLICGTANCRLLGPIKLARRAWMASPKSAGVPPRALPAKDVPPTGALLA